MIYLNNAATSYPKPQSVIDAVSHAMQAAPPNSLRSTAMQGDDLLMQLRESLGQLLRINDSDRIFLTSGATDAINRIITGLGAVRIVATTDNHNSVLRPIHNLPDVQEVLMTDDIDHLPKGTVNEDTLWIVNHCSNVTGEIRDIETLCAKAHDLGMMVMVDASQSAGCIPVDVNAWGVDILVFTGHKALMGPQGTGGYYVRHGIDLRPSVYGGTGRDSTIIDYTDETWEYEVGTPNMPGLAGLKAGIDYVMNISPATILKQENTLANILIQQLRGIDRVTVYSPGGQRQGPVVSFNIEGLFPSDAGYILQNSYGITLRTGLHCAPLIHKKTGTYPHGTLRASLSCYNTHEDINALVDAVRDISKSL